MWESQECDIKRGGGGAGRRGVEGKGETWAGRPSPSPQGQKGVGGRIVLEKLVCVLVPY